jgi:hypothetical protein
MVNGLMLTTPMLLCDGCQTAVDGVEGGGPLVWVEDGYVFFQFADGVFAARYVPGRDGGRARHIIVNLPDDTTYQPGRSSLPSWWPRQEPPP